MAESAKLEFSFSPDWRFLRQLRHFVRHLVTARTSNQELAEHIGMAVAELTENMVKYARGAQAVVRLEISSGRPVIRVEAENDADPGAIEELTRVLAQVNRGTPDDAYLAALAAVGGDEPGSKLGLARVRAEAQMALSCEVRDRRVRVIAERAA
ncbi:MAG: hypothetical protein HYZ28_21705 [Myxococcales bacterium]|nr:hypothetical protein [Myxococcales bacterium]